MKKRYKVLLLKMLHTTCTQKTGNRTFTEKQPNQVLLQKNDIVLLLKTLHSTFTEHYILIFEKKCNIVFKNTLHCTFSKNRYIVLLLKTLQSFYKKSYITYQLIYIYLHRILIDKI